MASAGAVPFVEQLGVPAAKVSHPNAQAAHRRFDDEVKVVVHQAVRKRDPFLLGRDVPEKAQKKSSIAGI
jgi:hypothetical protein